ncbi:DNase I-like protein [Bimuria novae-zelandiae CBS 107.79]|uniref:DNA-(apurinic or apyrimidinic site) endonuclease 2 n=1 Tax=Bimuria novae-zelandiae CBS 107.79 TaxID=1447943 RepID=A0A6A5V0S5_9PLEO|nr:DNase I-like protein [Bimuria novae-zelandiae CBS 107.79]
MRITTWNVNGIRNPFGYQPWREKRTFNAMFDILEADIVIMQELKIQRKDLTDDMVLVPGWDCYFSLPKHKKGYSGVGIYTHQAVCAPIHAEEGLLGVLCPPGSSTPYRELPDDAAIGGYPTPAQVASLGVDPAVLDAEGRCVVLEFPAFVLFGVYSPANSNGLRDDFRYGFLTALDTRIRNLAAMGKRVVLTGDLNVSREEIDTAKAEELMHQEGLTREDYLNAPNRRVFNQLIEHGRVPGERDPGRERPVLWDLCRELHPKREGMFTHWEQKINARPGNFGSRIDYVLCSIEMKSWFVDANIQEGLMGSDHCPVYASTKDVVDHQGEQVHILDLMNSPGTFKAGTRLREFDPAQDIVPLSGRLLPEFDKRRSIKEMFSKITVPIRAPSALSRTSSSIPEQPTEHPNTITSPDKPRTRDDPHSDEKLPRDSVAKRPASTALRPRDVKKSKTSAATSPKGQQSLKGFFAPKPKSPIEPRSGDASHAAVLTMEPPRKLSTSTADVEAPTSELVQQARDPEASKQSWDKLFSKKPPPRCESHNEPCISLTTKKTGINCGRQFWICSRPLGPSGQKENGTEWRCGTFIWASDWNASHPRT